MNPSGPERVAEEFDQLASMRASWQRFLDRFEPLRPELYRYCRYLTHSPWDAEDLVQDTMARAYATSGTMFRDVPNPRAWLFRVASNLWIDRMRRARGESDRDVPDLRDEALEARALREAAGTLLVRLSPQERAAVVLKEAFDFSLEEIAEALSTSLAAVKAALHRGRGKLAVPEQPVAHAVSAAVLDAFCAAFNARDLARLTALLLDTATVEIVGVVTEYGPDAAKDPHTGSFAGMLAPISFDERGGVRPELLDGYLGTVARCELRSLRGDPVLVFWYEHEQGPAVRAVMTVEIEDDQLAHVRNYFFSPDVLAEVCAELGVPYRSNGYRYW